LKERVEGREVDNTHNPLDFEGEQRDEEEERPQELTEQQPEPKHSHFGRRLDNNTVLVLLAL
jgi:hypothetical protein